MYILTKSDYEYIKEYKLDYLKLKLLEKEYKLTKKFFKENYHSFSDDIKIKTKNYHLELEERIKNLRDHLMIYKK